MNRRFLGIFVLLATFWWLSAYYPSHMSETMSSRVSMGGALEPRNVRLGRLMAALQNGRNIGYGHLHFSSVNGREKYVRLVAINTQMLVKLSD
jgi:hypothetical protein